MEVEGKSQSDTQEDEVHKPWTAVHLEVRQSQETDSPTEPPEGMQPYEHILDF